MPKIALKTHMAATTTASSDHHKIHLHKKPTTAVKFRRRRSTFSSTTNHQHQHPSVVSPEYSSWCCPSAVSSLNHNHKPPPATHLPTPPQTTTYPRPSSDSPVLASSPESFSDDSLLSVEKSHLLSSDSPVNLDKITMSTTTAVYGGGINGGGGGGSNHQETFPSSFTNFNSALTAGLLNPMSPPPPIIDKTRSSPTLFEMMANEPDCKIPNNSNGNVSYPNPKKPNHHVIPPPIIVDKQALMQQRLLDLLSYRSPGSQFNDPNSSDVKLTLTSKDGMSVSMNAHRQILVGHSRFFAVKLSDNYRWKTGQQQPYNVEIADCDDIEVYIESIRLMYCKDLRKKLMREDVPRVLGILKVSAAIGFDAGVLSCLEYLEAAPWAEDEEEKVSSLLSELRLEEVGAVEVLKRVSVDTTSGIDEGNNNNEEVLLKLLHIVLEGKDEKARREMKVLVAKMLRENSSHNDLRKESLYSACDKCLLLLRTHFLNASNGELQDVAQITRQADNLHWLLDILTDRQIAEDFLKSWASLTELSEVHSKVPPLHRYEISRVTARLFVGIGKGQLLASKDSRCLLLQTWLVPFYDDFPWMKRASRGLDRHLIEDGLGNTILTLPLSWQQEILMTWFDRFLNSSDDCPNIQRAFEVWWRRAFWKKNRDQPERSRSFRITNENFKNS